MKVVLINGSPHEKGCTYTALKEVADTLQNEGIDAEIVHIGKDPIAGCTACGYCSRTGKNRCVINDKVNQILEKLETADGLVVGALPYGRLAGKALADGCSPNGGTDHDGPTAVLKSVSKVNHEVHTSGTLLNMRLDPVSVEGDMGLRRISQIIRTFVDLNIYHIQFNVVSSEVLRCAQETPEDYKSLIVRVAGYSAYFTELCREMQDDIIHRTIHTA